MTFQRIPEPKAAKARVHLDLFVDHAQPMFDGGELLEHLGPPA